MPTLIECGSDLYKGEVCFLNQVDKRLYPSPLQIGCVKEVDNLFVASTNFRAKEFVKINTNSIDKA